MNKEDSYVTCQLYGQLGNQLYQIATTLAYAWDYGAIPIFPFLHRKEDRISYNRDRIFFRLDSSIPPRSFLNVFKESEYYSAERVPFLKDLILNGHFQSWKHFHHHRERLLSIFAPSVELLASLQSKYSSVLTHPKAVGLHLRTHSKILHENHLHPFIGIQYYRDAMQLFDPDTLFVVFSDRIGWCQEYLPRIFDKNMVFIEGNDLVEDLFLLARLPHQIIGNSTFGWWASYLNENADKIVVSPRFWRDPAYFPGFPVEDFFLPEWKLLDTTFDHAYPEGMERAVTKSVNN